MIPLILLVEDNASDVELIRTAFEEICVPVRFTVHRDGDAAIAGIRQAARDGVLPDLVLLDLNLPRASGLEVLVALRALPAFAGTPVVVFSTSARQADRSRCLHAGAEDYLVKPAHFDDLLTQVQELCRRWLVKP